jgi:hypothetical protein
VERYAGRRARDFRDSIWLIFSFFPSSIEMAKLSCKINTFQIIFSHIEFLLKVILSIINYSLFDFFTLILTTHLIQKIYINIVKFKLFLKKLLLI